MDTPELTRRRWLAGAGAAVIGGVSTRARAQVGGEAYRILCGFPPGGPADLICRKLAERLTERTKLQAVVENKVGGSGRVAVAELMRSEANGLTLLVTPTSVLTMYPHLYKQLAYDPFADLAPLCTVGATSFALAVGPAVPETVQTLQDMVRWGRAQGEVACGNSGVGSVQHFLGLLLSRESGLRFTHVPYRGGAPSMQAVAGGEVACSIATESAARSLVQAGKVRVLATTGTQRSASFPRVPTFTELGWPALQMREWFGAFAPGRTVAPAIERTASHLLAATAEPGMRETLERQSLLTDHLSTHELRQAIRAEHDFWAPLVRASGISAEV